MANAQQLSTFTIPKSVRSRPNGGTLPEKLSFRELTSDEELAASRVGGFDVSKTRYDACKRALVRADGKPLLYSEGEIDILWESLGPKGRALALEAYDEVHGIGSDERAGFLKSMTVEAVSVA